MVGLLVPLALLAQAECLKCHTAIALDLQKPFTHPGECETCHVNHRLMPGERPYLKQAQPELCLGCHAGAKHAQPVEHSVCTGCHDPHGARQRALLYEFQHGPFGGRHCDECHGPPRNGKVEIHGGDVRQLCLGCHVVIGNKLAASKSAHRQFVCTRCHTPHTSDYQPHLKMPRAKLCESCHKQAPAGEFQH